MYQDYPFLSKYFNSVSLSRPFEAVISADIAEILQELDSTWQYCTVAAVEKVDFLESEFKADRRDIFLKVHKHEYFFGFDF